MALVSALAIGVGGSLGAVSRYAIGVTLRSRTHGTVVVNVVGSFIFGIVLGVGVENPVTLALTVGFCGAFTTFSSFAVETVQLAEDGEWGRATANAAGTLLVALLAVLVGGALGGVL